MRPTAAPVTDTAPSTAPSLTGLVVLVDVTRPVTDAFTQDEIDSVASSIADSFGVEDVKAAVEYINSGSMRAIFDADISDEEIANQIIAALSSALDINPADISITVTFYLPAVYVSN